ncbi:hypothetical protein NDU88_000126 [Pleurodeles waltl]|uniref:Uncharacterized protein n=1 Tax=Pleurodeles waltl TaxID=8319 RepID=A0AAV7MGZ1_PLEWA|nr:hypothetical protein NDU88_000126 [Pleurodeles waltl]
MNLWQPRIQVGSFFVRPLGVDSAALEPLGDATRRRHSESPLGDATGAAASRLSLYSSMTVGTPVDFLRDFLRVDWGRVCDVRIWPSSLGPALGCMSIHDESCCGVVKKHVPSGVITL